ncbi:hypothetical protein KM043_011198 [Ampulex compressa]|nr:hypothetical protein KM043_011198 [Ampulex compressa]
MGVEVSRERGKGDLYREEWKVMEEAEEEEEEERGVAVEGMPGEERRPKTHQRKEETGREKTTYQTGKHPRKSGEKNLQREGSSKIAASRSKEEPGEAEVKKKELQEALSGGYTSSIRDGRMKERQGREPGERAESNENCEIP